MVSLAAWSGAPRGSFVSRHPPRAALELAQMIAAKSPVAVLGAKTFLNYTRDHTVDDSLDYAITWNQGMFWASLGGAGPA